MTEEPQPDAMEPHVLAKELENILVAGSGGKLSRPKCEDLVQRILTKQMQFYAAVATPEITANAQEQYQVISDLQGTVEALIRCGAQGVEHMLPDVRVRWQTLAGRARTAVNRLTEMLA